MIMILIKNNVQISIILEKLPIQILRHGVTKPKLLFHKYQTIYLWEIGRPLIALSLGILDQGKQSFLLYIAVLII